MTLIVDVCLLVYIFVYKCYFINCFLAIIMNFLRNFFMTKRTITLAAILTLSPIFFTIADDYLKGKKMQNFPQAKKLNLPLICRKPSPIIDIWKLERDDYEFVMTLALMKFWYLFGQHAPEIMSNSQVETNQEKRLHKLLNYMHSNYASHLSVAAISDAANISESECYRLFRNTLKTTPNNYLLSHRLRVAAQMLVESDKAITQIAYEVGFSCPAYFAKKFKLAFGKTPKVFKKESRLESA